MPLRLPGIAHHRRAIRPGLCAPRLPTPGLRAGLCVSSAALCAAAPRLATSELFTAGILSAALPRSLRPRCRVCRHWWLHLGRSA